MTPVQPAAQGESLLNPWPKLKGSQTNLTAVPNYPGLIVFRHHRGLLDPEHSRVVQLLCPACAGESVLDISLSEALPVVKHKSRFPDKLGWPALFNARYK